MDRVVFFCETNDRSDAARSESAIAPSGRDVVTNLDHSGDRGPVIAAQTDDFAAGDDHPRTGKALAFGQTPDVFDCLRFVDTAFGQHQLLNRVTAAKHPAE